MLSQAEPLTADQLATMAEAGFNGAHHARAEFAVAQSDEETLYVLRRAAIVAYRHGMFDLPQAHANRALAVADDFQGNCN